MNELIKDGKELYIAPLNWRGRKKCNTISIMAGITYNLKKFNKAVIDLGWDGIKVATA